MRSANYFLAGALIMGVSGTAMAQASPPPTPAPAIAPANDVGLVRSHWMTAGFVGSNFGAAGEALADNHQRINFGGQLGYLWKGVVGGEFLADFALSSLANGATPDNSHLNSYMANAIGALPLGAKGQFQPYVSGGYGAIQMRANVVTAAINPLSSPTTSSDNQITGGANVGGGIMAYAGKLGFRGEVRYYRTGTNNNVNGTLSDQGIQTFLSGIDYWRGNVGFAFQW